MAPAEEQVVSGIERRRSERWPLALPLIVRGVSLDAKSFQEETFTLSVSAHGALLALATTVTLGQTLFLRNPQTQDEAGAWVMRLGLPRGGWTQVGIEFVRPDADFWFKKPQAKAAVNAGESRSEERIHVLAAPRVLPTRSALPHPSEDGAAAAITANSGSHSSQMAVMTQTTSLDTRTSAALESPDGLLRALDQALREAVDQAVAAAATERLYAAVNQAAAAIETFSQGRMRQMEERLVHYRHELANSAREDFFLQVRAEAARAEEHLRRRAEELIGDAAQNAQSDFNQRLCETATQAAAQFAAAASDSAAQHFVHLAERAQAAASEVQARLNAAAAGLQESQQKAKNELDTAVTDTRQKVESLTTQIKETCAEWETRLNSLQGELAHSKEQEVEEFRERLRNVLSTLLGSLE